eukprot:7965035-Ditylum_brightwellii.AAC.1
MKTALVINYVLYFKIAQWCNLPGILIQTIPNDAVGDAVRLAIEEQNTIEWDNLAKGRATHLWAEEQMHYVKALNQIQNERDFDQDQWSSQLVIAI